MHHTYNKTLYRRKETGKKELTTFSSMAGKKKLRNRIDLEHNTLDVHFLKQKTIICFSLDTLIKKLTGSHLERYIVNTPDIGRGMRLGTRSERRGK